MTTLKLNMPLLSSPISSLRGEYADPCTKCALKDVCVEGCCASHSDCIQTTCYRDCNDCGGGDLLRGTGANVPAICSKAPLRELLLSSVRKDAYKFTSRPRIKLKAKSIIITQGSPGRVNGCPYPKGCEAIAVNLRHVWSTRGWFSTDMRDYLKIGEKSTKLILLTHTHDDVLERAWDAGVHYDDLSALGFDYWQGIEFSQYGYMSRYNSLWVGYRSLFSIEASKAHFCISIPPGLSVKKGPDSYQQFGDCAKALPQLMVNWQFTSLKDTTTYKWMVGMLKRDLKYLQVKSIWFVGVVSAEMIFNLVRTFPNYDCYFLAVNPWLAAHKGDEFMLTGKLKKSVIPKTDLVLLNQHNYAKVVRRGFLAAKKQTVSVT